MKNHWGIKGFKKRDRNSLGWRWIGAPVWWEAETLGMVFGHVVEANYDTGLLGVEAYYQHGFRRITAVKHPRDLWTDAEWRRFLRSPAQKPPWRDLRK